MPNHRIIWARLIGPSIYMTLFWSRAHTRNDPSADACYSFLMLAHAAMLLWLVYGSGRPAPDAVVGHTLHTVHYVYTTPYDQYLTITILTVLPSLTPVNQDNQGCR
jgi:hypothetical protein